LTIGGVFSNAVFLDLIVSLGSTYILYFVASFMFFEPWHMFTSFIQYLLLSPSYINVLNVYAFCNTHDISWGTRPDVPPPIKNGKVTTTDGKADLNVPSDDKDLDEQYEAEMRVLSTRAVVKVKEVDDVQKEKDDLQKQKDYYAGVRSGVVLAWMFTNFALAAVILNSGGLNRLASGNEEMVAGQRSAIYLRVVLWSVAALSAFRFIGATWFLVLRLVRSLYSPTLGWMPANMGSCIVPWCIDDDLSLMQRCLWGYGEFGMSLVGERIDIVTSTKVQNYIQRLGGRGLSFERFMHMIPLQFVVERFAMYKPL
jgi:chitin synthase